MITPNLQKLVDNGIALENHYVQPICTPTRSALLTGYYPIHTGRQHDVFWPQEPKGLFALLSGLLHGALDHQGQHGAAKVHGEHGLPHAAVPLGPRPRRHRAPRELRSLGGLTLHCLSVQKTWWQAVSNGASTSCMQIAHVNSARWLSWCSATYSVDRPMSWAPSWWAGA